MRDLVVVCGIVDNIVYQNAENGFAVFDVDTADGVAVLCVGNIPALNVGENLRLTGSYVVHSIYGKQLSVELYERTIPDTEYGLEKYLGSGVIKGVRERLARKIVERFEKDTLNIIENFPERLSEIKGITLEKAMSISATFHEQAEMRRVVMYLQELGVSTTYAMKVYKKYKENTYEVIKTNPYSLADDIFGIGFKIADSIAFKAGIPKDSPFRVQAGIKYTLNQGAGNGHTYLPKKILLGQVSELLDVPGEIMENCLSQLQFERIIWQESVEDEVIVYLNSYYGYENYVARKLMEISATVIDKSSNAKSEIKKLSKDSGIDLSKSQENAVVEAMSNGVLVITGGPGTGKTTTINTIINLLQKDGNTIELAAPTGRAAKRLSEATGVEAKTLHRLLEIVFSDDNEPQQKSFGKDRENPLETDVVIVDESSMVDIVLMNSLLSAIAPGTRLILVGDIDQLPSVGAGNVLRDIIASGCIKVVRLTEIFRQAQESAIVMNAHRINQGEYPILNEKKKDFFFTRKASVEDITKTLVELIMNRLPKYIDCDLFQDIQVLTPMRKSPLGVDNLNLVLQKSMNPGGRGKKEKEMRNFVFREGDKIMQIKNNYNIVWKTMDGYGRQIDEGTGVFNGDSGIIRNIDEYNEVMTVRFDDNKLVDYDFSKLDELELAYAITIHKSQGSEYKIVVIPIHSGPPMLMSRNLLYTAVTRARELVVIVGIYDNMCRMIDNQREINRYSSLDRRILRMSEVMG